MCWKSWFVLCVVFLLGLGADVARPDVLDMPNGQTSLQFVTVGDPGNVADPATGYGSVPYTYQMGKYDVTLAQYTEFLNAVAKTDPYGLYNSGMANGYGWYPFGISQSGSPGSYTYSVSGANSQASNMPVTCVTWGDAARFCNWLQNGQPTGPEGNGTTETGAYTLSGDTGNLMTETRNPGATYVIPTENEWYKAAYFDPANASYWSYPTQSNAIPSNLLDLADSSNNDANYSNNGYTDPTNYLTPVGVFDKSPGPFGTYDMGGDVWQWNETAVTASSRGVRGASWYDGYTWLDSSTRLINDAPTSEGVVLGFRVASVPEPGSITLIVAGTIAGLWWWRRRRATKAAKPPAFTQYELHDEDWAIVSFSHLRTQAARRAA